MNDCRHAFRLSGPSSCVRCGHYGRDDLEVLFYLISGPDGATWWAAANEDDAMSGYLAGYTDGSKYLEFLQLMAVSTIPPKEAKNA